MQQPKRGEQDSIPSPLFHHYDKEGFPMKKLSKKVESLIGLASKSDVNGSYTGKPLNPKEKPVQDADDL